jgi:hypothetical protein
VKRATVALALAVIHHGSANMSTEGKPANKNTVLETASTFLAWLDEHDVEAGDDDLERHQS